MRLSNKTEWFALSNALQHQSNMRCTSITDGKYNSRWHVHMNEITYSYMYMHATQIATIVIEFSQTRVWNVVPYAVIIQLKRSQI